MSNIKTGSGTVHARFSETVRQYPDNPFLHIPLQAVGSYSSSAIDFSYQQMQTEIELLSEQYNAAGYGPGHRVALLLENRAEFFQHFFALNNLGVCVVPVNGDFVVEEIAYLLENSEVSVVVFLSEYGDKLEQALTLSSKQIASCRLEDMKHLPTVKPVTNTEVRTGTMADAAILYTSGTTGKPKGCVLSNEFFFCVGDWYVNIGGYCELQPGVERLITPLPVVHTNALVWSMMAMIQTGGCIIQLDRFHSSTWWATVRETRATCLHYLGVMPAMLLNLPESDKDLNEQIKFGLGAGVEPDLHARFEKRFGFPLIEGWAMTETGSGVCFMSDREPRHVGKRCMGRVLDTMEYRIVDPEGEDVEIGDVGELLVRRKGENPAYGFFTEYYKNPGATSEAWEGGWFHTGDAVRQDSENSVFFVERLKNIIRRSGENIAAAEVEAVLIEHSFVTNCAVAPTADEIREEEVVASITLHEGVAADAVTAEKLVKFCLEKLSYFKVPGYIIFLEKLPVSATQKIQRGELRKLVSDCMDSGRYIDCRTLKKKPK